MQTKCYVSNEVQLLVSNRLCLSSSSGYSYILLQSNKQTLLLKRKHLANGEIVGVLSFCSEEYFMII